MLLVTAVSAALDFDVAAESFEDNSPAPAADPELKLAVMSDTIRSGAECHGEIAVDASAECFETHGCADIRRQSKRDPTGVRLEGVRPRWIDRP